MLSSASLLQIFSGISINNSGFQVSHLQFADDSILFIKNDLKSVMGVKQVLQCFELLSGLKINFHKSKMYGFGTDILNVPFWATRMGCGIGTFPFTYLGMQLGSNPRNKSFWQPNINNMNRNLALWKSKLLNQAGKTVLLKSVINSTPNYWFNIFAMPKQVQDEIEKIRRCFFWGEEKRAGVILRKMHTLNWNTLCLPKKVGGLNLASLHYRNGEMLGKWWWRIQQDRGSLWYKIVVEIYGVSTIQDLLSLNISRKT